MNELKVKVTAYKQNIIIETIDRKEDKNFVPFGGSRFGCVLIETDKYLGMSEEAFKLLKTLKKSHDDIGDVTTWKTNDNKDCFAWIGNLKKIVNMEKAEGDKDGIIDIKHVTIENDVPPEAQKLIDDNL
jgi:hypothetical protein